MYDLVGGKVDDADSSQRFAIGCEALRTLCLCQYTILRMQHRARDISRSQSRRQIDILAWNPDQSQAPLSIHPVLKTHPRDRKERGCHSRP